MSNTAGPTEPSRPTVKRLFALSGNRCAFPNCPTRLVDRKTCSVVGEVCHIKGEKPTAKRYDANQTNLERHGFENQIVLCNVHHKVIDDDSQTYSVERLKQMKEDHEAKLDGKEQVDEQTAEAFATAVTNYFVQHGSVIHTTNMTGGQVAHAITNNFFQTPNLGGTTSRRGDHRLSEQALAVLREAANGDGSILVIKADLGLAVLAGNRQVNEMGNARSEAQIRQIIENLRSAGFLTLTDSTGSGDYYKLTHSAYDLIDATN